DELQTQLATEQLAAAEARQQVDELLQRLEKDNAVATEHEKDQAELHGQRNAINDSESQWREQLDAAQTQRKELEAAWADATDRCMSSEEELTRLRQAHDEVLARLAAEQQTTLAARRQAEELKHRFTRQTTDFERARADLEKQRTDQKRVEREWNERLNTAKA